MKQLQDIYVGKTKDCQQLGSNLPIKKYATLDGESVNLFEQKVLGDQRAIATFRERLDDGNSQTNNTFIQQLPTLERLRTSIQDFESY